MPIWKLTPTDLTDPNWMASSHRGYAIVRAPDEETARAEAQKAFGVAPRFKPGTGLHYPPWTRAALVEVRTIEDRRYEPGGPTEILYPLAG